MSHADGADNNPNENGTNGIPTNPNSRHKRAQRSSSNSNSNSSTASPAANVAVLKNRTPSTRNAPKLALLESDTSDVDQNHLEATIDDTTKHHVLPDTSDTGAAAAVESNYSKSQQQHQTATSPTKTRALRGQSGSSSKRTPKPLKTASKANKKQFPRRAQTMGAENDPYDDRAQSVPPNHPNGHHPDSSGEIDTDSEQEYDMTYFDEEEEEPEHANSASHLLSPRGDELTRSKPALRNQRSSPISPTNSEPATSFSAFSEYAISAANYAKSKLPSGSMSTTAASAMKVFGGGSVSGRKSSFDPKRARKSLGANKLESQHRASAASGNMNSLSKRSRGRNHSHLGRKLRRDGSQKTLAERRGSVDTGGGESEYRYPIPFPKIKLNTDSARKIKANTPRQHSFKVVLIGPSKSGKTSIIRRLVLDTFRKGYKMTLGVNYTTFHCTVPIELIEEVTKDENMQSMLRSDGAGGTGGMSGMDGVAGMDGKIGHNVTDSGNLDAEAQNMVLYDIPEYTGAAGGIAAINGMGGINGTNGNNGQNQPWAFGINAQDIDAGFESDGSDQNDLPKHKNQNSKQMDHLSTGAEADSHYQVDSIGFFTGLPGLDTDAALEKLIGKQPDGSNNEASENDDTNDANDANDAKEDIASQPEQKTNNNENNSNHLGVGNAPNDAHAKHVSTGSGMGVMRDIWAKVNGDADDDGKDGASQASRAPQKQVKLRIDSNAREVGAPDSVVPLVDTTSHELGAMPSASAPLRSRSDGYGMHDNTEHSMSGSHSPDGLHAHSISHENGKDDENDKNASKDSKKHKQKQQKPQSKIKMAGSGNVEQRVGRSETLDGSETRQSAILGSNNGAMSVSTGNDYYSYDRVARLGGDTNDAKMIAERMGLLSAGSGGSDSDPQNSASNGAKGPLAYMNGMEIIQDSNNQAKLVQKENMKLEVTLEIVDVGFHATDAKLYQNVSCIVLVMDVTQKQACDDVLFRYKEYLKQKPLTSGRRRSTSNSDNANNSASNKKSESFVPVIIAANKCDLHKKRQLFKRDIRTYVRHKIDPLIHKHFFKEDLTRLNANSALGHTRSDSSHKSNKKSKNKSNASKPNENNNNNSNNSQPAGVSAGGSNSNPTSPRARNTRSNAYNFTNPNSNQTSLNQNGRSLDTAAVAARLNSPRSRKKKQTPNPRIPSGYSSDNPSSHHLELLPNDTTNDYDSDFNSASDNDSSRLNSPKHRTNDGTGTISNNLGNPASAAYNYNKRRHRGVRNQPQASATASQSVEVTNTQISSNRHMANKTLLKPPNLTLVRREGDDSEDEYDSDNSLHDGITPPPPGSMQTRSAGADTPQPASGTSNASKSGKNSNKRNNAGTTLSSSASAAAASVSIPQIGAEPTMRKNVSRSLPGSPEPPEPGDVAELQSDLKLSASLNNMSDDDGDYEDRRGTKSMRRKRHVRNKRSRDDSDALLRSASNAAREARGKKRTVNSVTVTASTEMKRKDGKNGNGTNGDENGANSSTNGLTKLTGDEAQFIEIVSCSAKNGRNVEKLFETCIRKTLPPKLSVLTHRRTRTTAHVTAPIWLRQVVADFYDSSE